MIFLQLFVAVLTLVANAFFVGGEFALVSVRRSQVEPLAEQGDRRARTVLWALEHVSTLMATAQLGITACTLVLGAVAEPAFAHILEPLFEAVGVPRGTVHPVAFALALAVATYLHMLFGEMVPKNVALAEPSRTALALAPPLVSLTRALRPAVAGVNALANAGLRLLRVEPRDEVASTFSDAELDRMVGEAGRAGLLDERSAARVRETLELTRRPVGAVMVPIDRIVSTDTDTTPAGLERLAATTGFSRFPVTGSDHRILGYLHVKDALENPRRDTRFERSALRPAPLVGTRVPIGEALTTARARRAHLAVVVDEAGRTVGMVTMEDLLRELVGGAEEG